MPLDDAALLKRWTARRDAEAFNAIVDRFAAQVYGTCRRILRNDADAEEVAQECFFALARSAGEIHSSLGGWLHRAATFKSRDRIRRDTSRRARERAYSETMEVSGEPDWDDVRAQVDEAIEALPEELRNAIVAHFLGRKTHDAIASELRIGRRAVSYRIQRGVELIRRDLARKGVALSPALLGPIIMADATAAPLSLTASLGKLAIASGSATAASGIVSTTSLLGSMTLMKAKAIAAAALVVLVTAGGFWVLTRTHDEAPGAMVAAPSTAGGTGERTPAAPEPAVSPSPRVSPAAATADEAPSITSLLALSRAELERAWENYPAIDDPQQFGSVGGVVLDQNGYPIPGAALTLAPTHNWGKLPGAGGLTRHAASGADGVYRIDGIDHSGPFSISASKEGFASLGLYVGIEAGKAATVDFALQAGVCIRGRVLSASGAPVSDANVSCLGVTGPRRLGPDQRRVAKTDGTGHFLLGFTDEEAGSVAALRVQSAEHGAATFPDIVVQDARPVELRLATPAIIQGTVRNRAGKALPGARVAFYGQKNIDVERADGARWDSPSFTGEYVAVSDAWGRYATEVDAGLEYSARATITGSVDERGRMEVLPALHPGETREYNPVCNTDSILVRATFVGQQSGRPIAGFVRAEALAYHDGVIVGSSREDGHFAVRFALPARKGTYTFQGRYTYHDDLVGDMSEPHKLRGGDDIDIVLNLPDPQTFAVQVVDVDGAPIEGAQVSLLSEGSSLAERYGRTDGDGRLAEPILYPPLCGARVKVEKPGYAASFGARPPDQLPGTVHPEETVVLWRGAGVEGDVVVAGGSPLANSALIVTATNRDGRVWTIPARTDDFGHFTILDTAPSDIVDITVTAADTEWGSWTTEAIALMHDTVTSVGTVTLE